MSEKSDFQPREYTWEERALAAESAIKRYFDNEWPNRTKLMSYVVAAARRLHETPGDELLANDAWLDLKHALDAYDADTERLIGLADD